MKHYPCQWMVDSSMNDTWKGLTDACLFKPFVMLSSK